MSEGIIGAGNWIVDKVKMIDRWPEAGALCNVISVQESSGGGPCNVLFDIVALQSGIPLYACGVLGMDNEGKKLIKQIKMKKIDSHFMFSCKGYPTSFTDVMTETSSGRRTFFHNRGANADLSFRHMELLDVDARVFYLGYLLLLDGLDRPDQEFGTVAAKCLSRMQARGCITVVDIVSEDCHKFSTVVPPTLRYIDCLVINELEAECCGGIPVRDSAGNVKLDALFATANKLLVNGVQQMVVIHFPEGAVAVNKDGTVSSVKSCYIEPGGIVGSVGAGDAFCAGIVYGLHEGLSVPEMLRLATMSAWFNLRSPTATDGAPDLATLLKAVENYNFKSLEM